MDKLVRDPVTMELEPEVLRYFPYLYRMIGFDQKNPHHDQTLLSHTIGVAIGVPDSKVLRLAAIFHDCGKIDTQVIDNGRARYHGHEKVGADHARTELTGLYSDEIIDDVCLLVSNHMRPLGYINQGFGNKGVRRLIKKAQGNNVDIYDLLTLNRSDIMAHDPKSVMNTLPGHYRLIDHIERVNSE